MHLFDDFREIVKADEPLAPHVWFRIGGRAAYLARPRTLDELLGLIRRCRAEGLPFKILSGGSNVLVRDEGVEALVIHLESPAFSDLTAELYGRYRRHLGRWRYETLLRVQSVLVPDHVRRLLGLEPCRLLRPALGAYWAMVGVGLRPLVHRLLMPPATLPHIRRLDHAG